jgi:hypothetical protein
MTSSRAPEIPVDNGGPLPDITTYLTPYILRTFETLYRIYGPSQVIRQLCLDIYYHQPVCNTRPTADHFLYDMRLYNKCPLPAPLPFVADHCAAIIPSLSSRHKPSQMDDIVEAMRHCTRSCPTGFHAPTVLEIQAYLFREYPRKYSACGTAKGWRNSVNQCITHGQGWNFLTFPPAEGCKLKRHLLFERAYNGSCIIGSGQCTSFHNARVIRNGEFIGRVTRVRERVGVVFAYV